MDTLYLSPDTWDLAVDSNGNIAMASNPYAPVQDAASAIRTNLGEVYFDTTQGIPYLDQILGHGLPLDLYRQKAINAALTVPDVASARVFFTQLADRALTGQVQVTLVNGTTSVINIGLASGNTFTLDSSLLDNPYDQLGY